MFAVPLPSQLAKSEVGTSTEPAVGSIAANVLNGVLLAGIMLTGNVEQLDSRLLAIG